MKPLVVLLLALTLLAPVPVLAQPSHFIQGTLVSVEHERNLLTLRGADGRHVAVDISMSPGSPNHRKLGERVTAVGSSIDAQNFRAEYVFAEMDRPQVPERYRTIGRVTSPVPTLAQHSNFIQGTLISVEHERNLLTLRAADGRHVAVDISMSPGSPNHRKLRERVTAVGSSIDAQNFRAEYVFAEMDRSQVPERYRTIGMVASPADGQRLHGTVESVYNSWFTVKTNDGRTMWVNMEQLSPAARKSVTANQILTVIGAARAESDEFMARSIQLDQQPAAGLQRLTGTIQGLNQKRLRLRTDDGRMVQVDITQLSSRSRRDLFPGASVALMGVFRNQNQFTARHVDQDSASGSASPAIR